MFLIIFILNSKNLSHNLLRIIDGGYTLTHIIKWLHHHSSMLLSLEVIHRNEYLTYMFLLEGPCVLIAMLWFVDNTLCLSVTSINYSIFIPINIKLLLDVLIFKAKILIVMNKLRYSYYIYKEGDYFSLEGTYRKLCGSVTRF